MYAFSALLQTDLKRCVDMLPDGQPQALDSSLSVFSALFVTSVDATIMPAISQEDIYVIHSALARRDSQGNNIVMIAVTVVAITALILIAYLFWRRFARPSKPTPPPTRPGIMKFVEEKPKLGPSVPVINVTMHGSGVSRSVTIPSLDFSFLAEYALDPDKSSKSLEDLGGAGKFGYRSLLNSTAQAFYRLRSSIKANSKSGPQISPGNSSMMPEQRFDNSLVSVEFTDGRARA